MKKCVKCHKEIERARLDILPETNICAECVKQIPERLCNNTDAPCVHSFISTKPFIDPTYQSSEHKKNNTKQNIASVEDASVQNKITQEKILMLTTKLNDCLLKNILGDMIPGQVVLYVNTKKTSRWFIPAEYLIGNLNLDGEHYNVSLWKNSSRAGRPYYSGGIYINKKRYGKIYLAQNLGDNDFWQWIGALLIDQTCYALGVSEKYFSETGFMYFLGEVEPPQPTCFSQYSLNFHLTERGAQHIKEHKLKLGYDLIANVHDLSVGDELAFPYGNNIFRAYVGFVGKLPDGDAYVVLNECVNLDVWEQKELRAQTRGARQLVFTIRELSKVTVLKKGKADKEYIKNLQRFYGMAFRIMGRYNFAVF